MTKVGLKLISTRRGILLSRDTTLHLSSLEPVSVSSGCKFVLGRTELTGGSSGLLQVLLLLGIGIADLDGMLLVVGLDGFVVEGPDDLFAVGARLEASVTVSAKRGVLDQIDHLPSKSDTTTRTIAVAKNACRAYLARSEDGSELL